MVIHGLLDTCSFVFSKCLFAFQSRVGLKKFRLKFQIDSCISPQECCEAFVLKSFRKCQCEKFVLFVFFRRASTQELSTYPKELGCVNVLKVVPSHH